MIPNDDQVVVTLLVQHVLLGDARSDYDSAIKLTSMETVDLGAHAYATDGGWAEHTNREAYSGLSALLRLLPAGLASPPWDKGETPPQCVVMPFVIEYVSTGDDAVIRAMFDGTGGPTQDVFSIPRPSETDTLSPALYELFARHLEIAGKLPASAYS